MLTKCYGPEQDDDALNADRRILEGEFTRNNLTRNFTWKTRGRGRSRLSANSDGEIADALKLATGARTGRAAMAVLLGLNGVQVPVASAILTAIEPERYAVRPERYTVIDFRALEALGTTISDPTVNFYLVYLLFCREVANAHQVILRDLDRALWQWSRGCTHLPKCSVFYSSTVVPRPPATPFH